MERSFTVAEFGELTSIFTREEARQERWMRSYLQAAEWDHGEFKVNDDRVWNRFSGIDKHTAHSKSMTMRSPLLRLIHKIVAHSYFHRSTQHDKVYSEDLWVLNRFSKRNQTKFINAPWALACYMEEKGAGRQHDSPMLCGHFISRIAKNLGILSQSNINSFTNRIGWKALGRRDFLVSKIITSEGVMVPEGEVMPRSPPREQLRGRGTLSKAMNRLTGQMKKMMKQNERIDRKIERVDRNVMGIGNYCNYVVDRYQPSWEAAAFQHHQSGSSSDPFMPYGPPMMFPPSPPREDEDEEDEEENEEDEDEEDEEENEEEEDEEEEDDEEEE